MLIYQKQGLRAETEVCVKKDTIYHTIEVEWDAQSSPQPPTPTPPRRGVTQDNTRMSCVALCHGFKCRQARVNFAWMKQIIVGHSGYQLMTF